MELKEFLYLDSKYKEAIVKAIKAIVIFRFHY